MHNVDEHEAAGRLVHARLKEEMSFAKLEARRVLATVSNTQVTQPSVLTISTYIHLDRIYNSIIHPYLNSIDRAFARPNGCVGTTRGGHHPAKEFEVHTPAS